MSKGLESKEYPLQFFGLRRDKTNAEASTQRNKVNYLPASFLLRLMPDLIPVSSPPYACPSSGLRTSRTAPRLRIRAFLYCSLFLTRGFRLILGLCATRPRFFIIVFPMERSPSTKLSNLGYLGATAYICFFASFLDLVFVLIF